MSDKPLLEVSNLKKYFNVGGKWSATSAIQLKAVDDVSFSIARTETLGLVGESGCGKTTCGRTIVRLYEPMGGRIVYDGTDITHLNSKQLMPYRTRMQMIFQDPYASLDPRMTCREIISEGIAPEKKKDKAYVKALVGSLLERVGLNSDHANRFPHEFSGGQRQRIGIARTLAIDPEFIICDEPISALDVSIQAQIINMLEDLQQERGLTYLFIAHDIGMVKHISKRIGVMYLGRLVEMGPAHDVFAHPQHPYTQALISSVPVPNPKLSAQRKRMILQGDVPSPLKVPSGCPFRTRCKHAMPICAEQVPALSETAPHHFTACFLLTGDAA
jgi:oligopeptide transport system ATP-binding protein